MNLTWVGPRGPSKQAKSEAPEILIILFEKTLRPRREREARELYAIGARDGGMMARQQGEPVSSYVAEQVLQNAGLTEDQKLIIRTTLRGKMEVILWLKSS